MPARNSTAKIAQYDTPERILSGPADDFQRREIKRRLETLPGVGEALWSADSLQTEQRQ